MDAEGEVGETIEARAPRLLDVLDRGSRRGRGRGSVLSKESGGHRGRGSSARRIGATVAPPPSPQIGGWTEDDVAEYLDDTLGGGAAIPATPGDEL